MSRIFQSSGGVALALALLATPAAAEPKDQEATSLAKEAMDGDYLGTEFQAAEQKLLKAQQLCEKEQCSGAVRAKLHLDLAIVYIAGLKQPDKGKKALQAAIAADGAVQLDPDFATPEIQKAFVAAGGVVGDAEPAAAAPETEPPATKKKRRRPDPDDDDAPAAAPKADDEAPESPKATDAPLNWLSLAFQLDLLSYKDTTGVCSGAAQYQCFLQSESYGGPLYRGSGNQLKGGVGFATKRVLLGYERVLADNVTLGAKLGFAFGGSPKATTGQGTAFLPFHAELRGSYWFGKAPFASEGLRGYAGLAAGLGGIDGHVTVEYYEDDAGYQAGAKGKLDAWRKTGTGFVGLHGGVAYAFAKQQQLFLELRVLQLLGATALGGAVNIGYAYGL